MTREHPPLPPDERRRRRVEYVVIAVAAVALIALGLLERNLYRFSVDVKLPANLLVFTLINVNLLLLLLLLFFLLRNIIKLVIERRSRILWSRLRTRLVLAFTLFSLFPTALLFFLTTGLVKRSVEEWFSGQVNHSMRRSVEVVETYYDESQSRALHFARQAAERLEAEGLVEGTDADTLSLRLEEMRRSFALWGLELYRPNFELQAAAVAEGVPVDITRFAFPFTRHLPADEPFDSPTLIETFAGQDLARAYTPIVSGLDGQTPIAYVVADIAVPANLLEKMAAVSATYEEYLRIRSLQSPLKTSFIFTLIMVFTMVILIATWVGMFLAKGISEPIQELARATHELSRGNFAVRVPPAGDDEIGSVIDSFNMMTAELDGNKRQIENANAELQARNVQLEAARQYMETLLASVAAGVVSVDGEGRITTINVIAAEFLGLPPDAAIGRRYTELLDPATLERVQELMSALRTGMRSVQRQWVLTRDEEVKTLLVNLTALRSVGGALQGVVLVFDDLTELVRAQRAAAWREVARRIAHEIKNPLTPIQLSAQRLRKRYLNRFEAEDKVFDECTRVIIEQVETMKTLVNEFSQFARMPQAQPVPNDLNAIAAEVTTLYKQAHPQLDLRFHEDGSLPLVELDREQVRRVVLNLLDNAVAAVGKGGRISLRTRYDRPLQIAVLEVADDGPGIPVEDRQRVFEPYFTTKEGGTGLGLSIVKKIMEDHQGYIRVLSNVPRGSVFVLEFPIAEHGMRDIVQPS